MKKIVSLPNTGFKKLVFMLVCIFLIGISCTKERSVEGHPHTGPYSIFTNQLPASQTVNDSTGTGIEVGVKFQSTTAGTAEGIRFYKSSGNIGTHSAQLYSADGTLMASKPFTSETDSGWQSVLFDSAIAITANTTYIAAYHSSLGNYTGTIFGLKTAITNTPLTALADGTDGLNGVYKYTNIPALPDSGYFSSNYWVDILLVPSGQSGY
jgi:hypothetical protein